MAKNDAYVVHAEGRCASLQLMRMTWLDSATAVSPGAPGSMIPGTRLPGRVAHRSPLVVTILFSDSVVLRWLAEQAWGGLERRGQRQAEKTAATTPITGMRYWRRMFPGSCRRSRACVAGRGDRLALTFERPRFCNTGGSSWTSLRLPLNEPRLTGTHKRRQEKPSGDRGTSTARR